jgi:hypothetical protein
VFGGAKSPVMTLHKIAKPLQIFAVLPILTANVVSANPVMVLPIQDNGSTVVVSQNEQNGLLFGKKLDNKQAEIEEKAQKIDNYFRAKNLPLAGHGKKFVEEAEKYGIPYNLLPAIGMRETTGGKFACKKVTYSWFGWGSCKINFKSVDESIEIISRHLGGDHPNTSKYYDGKDVDAILKAYNPPSVVEKYSSQVQAVMKAIDEQVV